MDKLDIKEFIPSKTFKDYITENNIELTDRQKAKIICKSRTSMKKKWDGYLKLMEESDNLELIDHLKNIICYEDMLMNSVYKQIDDAIYILTTYDISNNGIDYEKEESGIYRSITSAENIGKKCKYGFDITRYIVSPLTNEEQSKLENEMESKGYINDNYDMDISYNSSGEIDYIYSEDPINKELRDKCSDAEYYIKEYFADFPIPFKNGDIIMRVDGKYPSDEYGILFIPFDNDAYNKRLIENGVNPGDEFRAELICDNGEFGHTHLLVTEMDRVDIKEVPEKYRSILGSASDLVTGNGHGSIECLQIDIDDLIGK